MAWLAENPGAVAWLVGAAVVVAIRVLNALARRRAVRHVWFGQWFERSAAWPPRRGSALSTRPEQSDIGCGSTGKGGR
jgi:hypothetical protein